MMSRSEAHHLEMKDLILSKSSSEDGVAPCLKGNPGLLDEVTHVVQDLFQELCQGKSATESYGEVAVPAKQLLGQTCCTAGQALIESSATSGLRNTPCSASSTGAAAEMQNGPVRARRTFSPVAAPHRLQAASAVASEPVAVACRQRQPNPSALEANVIPVHPSSGLLVKTQGGSIRGQRSVPPASTPAVLIERNSDGEVKTQRSSSETASASGHWRPYSSRLFQGASAGRPSSGCRTARFSPRSTTGNAGTTVPSTTTGNAGSTVPTVVRNGCVVVARSGMRSWSSGAVPSAPRQLVQRRSADAMTQVSHAVVSSYTHRCRLVTSPVK